MSGQTGSEGQFLQFL